MIDGDYADTLLFVRADVKTTDLNCCNLSGSDPSIPDVLVTYRVGGGFDTVDYPDINNGNCKAFGRLSNAPNAVVCNGNLLDNYTSGILGKASEFTIVHELGHIFDYRTGVINGSTVDGGISLVFGLRGQVPSINDCRGAQNGLVQGENQGILWTRGQRGWGSGPAFSTLVPTPNPSVPLITNFQQNPNFFHSGKNTEEIIETSADMFLNWVYRLNANPIATPIDTCPISTLTPPPPSQWNGPGFNNTTWNWQSAPVGPTPGTTGTPDPNLSGDRRYWNMHKIVGTLAATQGW